MKQLLDTVWQRRGISWIWDDAALGAIARPAEVFSLRQLMRAVGQWPDDLPSNDGDTLVVAGLDGCLDLLSPADAEDWLGNELKDAVLAFQSHYQGETALVFWLPGGTRRISINVATDAVYWRCAAPYGGQQLDFGRVLWGESGEYPQEILLTPDAKPVGLFHLRIT